MLTIFSAPKPFRGRIDRIQRNAISSWIALGPEIQVLLLGEEPGIAGAAHELGVEHIAEVEKTQSGTPRVDSVFDLAGAAAKHQLLCYVNADIILLDDLLPALDAVGRRFRRYLLVGQRWDLDVNEQLGFGEAETAALRRRVHQAGQQHKPAGSDYFVFPKGEFDRIPPFALGRAGWDNWMIYSARSRRIPVVDASASVMVVHQNHDYAHLPGGQPHYRLPESAHNTALAGGRQAIFTLADASWRLQGGRVRRRWIGRSGLPRTVEAAVYSRLGAGRAARLARLLLHPIDTWRYIAHRSRAGQEESTDAPVAGRS